MYKRAITGLVLMNLVFLSGFLCIRGTEENRLAALAEPAYTITLDETLLADQDKSAVGISTVAASGQRTVDCDVVTKEYKYELDEENLEALLRIVEAEAGGEDLEGKLLVANVVLNRVEDEQFPDTVKEVVFQKENGVSQFSPVGNGRYYRVEISRETKEAVEKALTGEDISQGALYFAARKYADKDRMKWFDDNLCYLFKHGGHEFYTSPD